MAGQRETYKKLIDKIAAHGTETVDLIDPSWTQERIQGRERVLIVLEMLYQKAVTDNSLGAAREYLDRILGRPKESLNLTNGSDLISKISDEELTGKIATILKSTQKGGVGAAD